jgi:predicted amidohydrolase
MQDLNVTLIQTPLYWEDPSANRAMLEEKIWSIHGPTDLVVLPEMFTTGFSMNVKPLAEPMNLHTFKWMKQMAAQTGAVIAGSFMVQEQGRYYNRLLWMRPDGSFETYDKRHLFRMAEEHHTYSAGNKKIIVALKGWNICPLICYDLRFPVWSRNHQLEYDLCLYVANWPEVRKHPWQVLLQARAIENLSYVIGVNRVGTDGKNLPYSGNSSVINYKGEVLWTMDQEACLYSHTFHKEELISFRQKFPTQLDADQFSLATE